MPEMTQAWIDILRKAQQPQVSGPIYQGNIDLNNRPRVFNPDGSISTVRSVGVNVNGRELLLPTISMNGENLSVPEAVNEYKKTGLHMGVYPSPEESNIWARYIHEQQAKQLRNPGER